jgi:hypothetical protein
MHNAAGGLRNGRAGRVNHAAPTRARPRPTAAALAPWPLDPRPLAIAPWRAPHAARFGHRSARFGHAGAGPDRGALDGRALNRGALNRGALNRGALDRGALAGHRYLSS